MKTAILIGFINLIHTGLQKFKASFFFQKTKYNQYQGHLRLFGLKILN